MVDYVDSTRLAGVRTDTYAGPDTLIAGPRAIEAVKRILNAGNLKRGAVLGAISEAAAAAVAGTNTGNGTVGTVTLGAGAKQGTYKIIFVEPGTNLGTFIVEDPQGTVIGDGVVGTAFAGEIGFTITDGATDFVPGDRFHVLVEPDGSAVLLAASAATDGSQDPVGILVHDADATDDPVEVMMYVFGDFNQNALTFGTGHTIETVKAPLRALGIHLVNVLKND
jgi:hypothetical protein